MGVMYKGMAGGKRGMVDGQAKGRFSLPLEHRQWY